MKTEQLGAVQKMRSDLVNLIKGEVRFDDGSRALYATDASNYRQTPLGVVIPSSAEDVIETVRIAHYYGLPILARGGGTSLAGQCCNRAVIIDTSKYMNRILSLNDDEQTAQIEPGIVLDRLRDAAERHKLTFGPDPATHNHCTLGGMIGNNSCGIHSVYAGKTVDNIEELEILTYRGERMTVGATSDQQLEQIISMGGSKGEIYRKLKSLRDRYAHLIRERYPKIPRRVSGYNLDQLLPENGFHVARALVGSESTCVFILGAKVRLVYSPPVRSLVVLGFSDVYSAGDAVPDVMSHEPLGLEGIDHRLIKYMERKGVNVKNVGLLPSGKGWLLVEFGGETKSESDSRARELMSEFERRDQPPEMKLYDNKDEEKSVWEIRESGLGATAFVPAEPNTWPGWEDSAVPPERVGDYLRELRKLFKKYDYECSLYGHFGQGCIHTRIDFDLLTSEGIRRFRAFLDDASDLVLHFGGSLSGEHGDGQSRGELLPKMFGKELIEAFREFKSIWDPDWKMNPGKVVEPYEITENLRLGNEYNPPKVETHFKYSKEKNFAGAALRCVGVGKCRKTDSGVMCPSYMATKEEMHSTRGRARLLFEMMQGSTIAHPWNNEPVHDALDLCLACKGCKGECPVEVDMATYKAEFLSHYYEHKLRPLAGYSMGLIYWWSRMASLMPQITNRILHGSGLEGIAKKIAGVSSKRELPPFAKQTFRKWFNKRSGSSQKGPRILFWPDTFNNFFHPGTAQAAVEVLEDAGFQVRIPPRILCCGRPLYDFGMLDLAKRQLKQILKILKDEIESGTFIVGLEPSCISVFRDELVRILPDDYNAERLSKQTFLLSEFLQKKGREYDVPILKREALIQTHCHHQSVLNSKAQEELLSKMKMNFRTLDSGCCGMAGSFGFEKSKYDVSIKIGERVLLPAVRNAPPETLIIANGFSCREQIRQCTDRRAMHLAEVLRLAIANREGNAVDRDQLILSRSTIKK